MYQFIITALAFIPVNFSKSENSSTHVTRVIKNCQIQNSFSALNQTPEIFTGTPGVFAINLEHWFSVWQKFELLNFVVLRTLRALAGV